MMIHLVTAWRTPDRQGDPKVLYCGLDSEKASAAANHPPAWAERVEKAFVHDSFKHPFQRLAPAAPVPARQPAPKAATSAGLRASGAAREEKPATAIPPAEEVESLEEGPTLDLPK